MKALPVIVAAVAAVLAANARELNVFGNFEGSKLGAITPRMWARNAEVKAPNMSEIVAGESTKFALHVKNPTQSIPFYCGNPCSAKPGEKLTVSAEVKGAGVLRYGFYAYKAGNKWGGSDFTKKIEIAKPGEVKGSLVIADKFKDLDAIRVVIWFASGSDLTISEVESELTENK